MFNLIHLYKSLTWFIKFNLNWVDTWPKQSVKPKEFSTTAEEIIKLKEDNFSDTKNLREKFKSYIENLAKNSSEDWNGLNSGEIILSNRDFKWKDKEAVYIIISYINDHQKIEKDNKNSIQLLNLEMWELVSTFRYKIETMSIINKETKSWLKDLREDFNENKGKQKETPEVNFKDYAYWEAIFNSLSEEDKITLQETIWAYPDWNFWKKTYDKLIKFTSKNKDIKTFSDIIGNDSNVTNNSQDINDKEFIKQRVEATAYYSPINWQKMYATWSYSWDIRLQWSWKRTASWKAPKVWMVAMKWVDFWTKVIVPEKVVKMVWANTPVFKVEDRWWAIKDKKMDIYFWKWDKALRNALDFWSQKIDIQVAKNDIINKPERKRKFKSKRNTKLA